MPDEPTPRRTAAALGYDPENNDAPRLLAKGSGEMADRILAVAKEHNIPIQEDKDLVTLLAQLDLNQEIPPELYRTIAEILSFIYRTNNRWKEQNG
ncbi:MAG: EscU/YscU/HrcU family type III secretion system export apparatus switch protein [bacterium]|nr:EscU/YscU/HrcU family type III secretion system export apparatus switch protein [bacterium]